MTQLYLPCRLSHKKAVRWLSTHLQPWDALRPLPESRHAASAFAWPGPAIQQPAQMRNFRSWDKADVAKHHSQWPVLPAANTKLLVPSILAKTKPHPGVHDEPLQRCPGKDCSLENKRICECCIGETLGMRRLAVLGGVGSPHDDRCTIHANGNTDHTRRSKCQP